MKAANSIIKVILSGLLPCLPKISFAQWHYHSQWGLTEAWWLLIENFSQYPARRREIPSATQCFEVSPEATLPNEKFLSEFDCSNRQKSISQDFTIIHIALRLSLTYHIITTSAIIQRNVLVRFSAKPNFTASMIFGGPECGLQTRSRWESEWFNSTFGAIFYKYFEFCYKHTEIWNVTDKISIVLAQEWTTTTTTTGVVVLCIKISLSLHISSPLWSSG